MANKKISELTEKTTFGDDDFLAGTQGAGATDNRKYGKAAIQAAVGGGFVPLSGTEVGSPVTGDIEILQGKFLIVNGNGLSSGNQIGIRAAMDHSSSIGSKIEVKSNHTQYGGGSGVVRLESSYENKINSILVSGSYPQIRWLQTTEGSPIIADVTFKQLGIELESSNNPTYKGLYATAYHGANYDDNTYVQKKYVDDNFVPKAPNDGNAYVMKNGAWVDINSL